MKIIKQRLKLKRHIKGLKNIFFIPTMGALHNGHISLIKKAKSLSKKNGKIIVSLFVNPKQFNSRKDYESYPRNFKNDFKILKRLKIDILFIPTYNQIFLFRTKNKIYIDKNEKKLCGKFRPGHFKGVIDVINRFIEIIKPKIIFLGQKDFQQFFLIKKHVIKKKIKTKIIACKTVRNSSGLALSSRLRNLNKNEIKLASKITYLIKKEKLKIKENKRNKINLVKLKLDIKKLGINKVEYLESIRLSDLKKTFNPNHKFNIFISFFVGKTRLIDNI